MTMGASILTNQVICHAGYRDEEFPPLITAGFEQVVIPFDVGWPGYEESEIDVLVC